MGTDEALFSGEPDSAFAVAAARTAGAQQVEPVSRPDAARAESIF